MIELPYTRFFLVDDISLVYSGGRENEHFRPHIYIYILDAMCNCFEGSVHFKK